MKQRASNRGVLLSGQAATPLYQLEPLVETSPVTLSSNPCTVQSLWYEYKFGINDRKPAYQFTVAEKNTNSQMKHKYWLRDKVWQTIARFVRRRQIEQLSINQIHSVYRYNTSITKIIDALLHDKALYPEGVHTSLC